MNKNEKIIAKVKDLLRLANDNQSDDEGQTALVMARKLMVKHKIEEDMLEEEDKSVSKIVVLDYKKVFWWEKYLLVIVAKNFRSESLISSGYTSGSKIRKSKLILFGLKEDIELGKEIYTLSRESMLYYTKIYMQKMSGLSLVDKGFCTNAQLKTSYIKGFLYGLEQKFSEENDNMSAEYGERFDLAIQTPTVVVEEFKSYTQDFGTYKNKIPENFNVSAFESGKNQASNVDINGQKIE